MDFTLLLPFLLSLQLAALALAEKDGHDYGYTRKWLQIDLSNSSDKRQVKNALNIVWPSILEKLGVASGARNDYTATILTAYRQPRSFVGAGQEVQGKM